MRVSQKYPTYLKAADLQGRPVRVQIKHVDEDVELGKDKELKDVVHFKHGMRPLVLNRTNAAMLASILGDDSDSWRNGNVILYPVSTPTGYGIRVQEYREVERETEAELELEVPKIESAQPDEANPPFNWGDDLVPDDEN